MSSTFEWFTTFVIRARWVNNGAEITISYLGMALPILSYFLWFFVKTKLSKRKGQ